jgi:signal transduction histidine kinase
MSALSTARQKLRGTADLRAVYEELSATIKRLLDAGSVFLICWECQDAAGEYLCQPYHDLPALDTTGIRKALAKNSPLRLELEQGHERLFTAAEAASLPVPLQRCLDGEGLHSLLLSPMMVDENVNGVLVTALRQQTESFTLAQTELISKMARDLAGLNEYATFLERSRALVAAEERNRLARDLHDSVTQVLFSASLVAEVLPTIWQRDPERAAESLEELRRLTRGALAEMRTMLLELRPSAVSKSPLHDLLAQLTEASTSRTELSFRLALEKTPRLPENVHASFYRVAQEALNNVAKHARASQVTLELHVNPQKPEQAGERRVELRLVVEDDGTGFSPENEQQLGLGIMRERAADIQADLTIDSRIGEGTCVSLVWCGIIKTNHE